MSLQIWLPLTKDLRQQGLSNATVTNNGATFNSAGKLGGCYSFDGSNDGIRIDGDIIPQLQQNNFSICFWLFSNDAGDRSIYIATTPASDWGFSIEKTTANKLRVYWQSNPDFNSSLDIPDQQWCHIAVVIKDGNCYCYKNGEKLAERTSGDMTPARLSRTWVYAQLGRDTRTGSTVLKGKMNDFRWYDHALSQMEVKELAKGLVLHYPLNRQGWGQENLLTDTNFTANSIASIGVSNAVNLGQWKRENSNVTLSMDNEYVKLHYETNTSRYGIHYEISLEPGTYTYSITAGGRMTCTFGLATGWPSTNLITANSAGRYSATFTVSETANYRMYIYTTNAYPDIWFNWPKLEKGSIATPWCPNSSDTLATTMGLNSTTEYDCSGFCNNGIQNNLPTYSSDTAKYCVSTHLDGVNQTIQLPNLLTLIPDSIFTFNIWFKRLESEPSSKSWETILGGPNGFELESCSANNVHDAKIKAYSWGGGNFAFEFDKWNMLTMVSNGTNALFYLNGELKLTGTYKVLVSGNYFLGSWKDTSTQNYKGYMSDARIYATALSADDIQSLYQNSAYIDSSGNVYGIIHEV